MNIDRRLFQLLRQERALFILSVVSGCIASAMLIGQAYALSSIIDTAFIERQGTAGLIPLTGLFALFSTLRILFNWASHIEAIRATSTIRENLFNRLTRTVATLGPLFTRSVQSGRLSTTLLKGVEALDPYFSNYIPQLFFALFTPLLILCAIFPGDWLSGIILLLSAPLIPFFMIVIGKSARAVTEKQWRTMSRMSGHFLDVLQGLPTLKLFAQGGSQRKSIEQTGETFRKSTMKVLKIAFLSSLTLELVGTLGTAAIAVSIALRLMGGHLSFQHALFVLLLTPDYYLPLRQLGTKFHAGMEGVTASKEIFAILDRNTPAPERKQLDPTQNTTGKQDLCFTDVTYTYPGALRPAIEQINATFPAGQTTAIVGPSGSGKSTMISLLLRFQEPRQGTITIGGRPLADIPVEEWHRAISWVPQHPYLFNASLKDNILLARPDASEEDLTMALEKTGLSEFVGSLPEGLDTMIGEQGSRLSGGEAQRIALARAFLKNAPLLVLDEPTSHTDPSLEAILRNSIRELMKGRTTVMIAHRHETIRSADMIIVVSQGRITACGTHDKLIGMEGFYHDSFLLQQEETA
jgi:ATP-binding cassette subfamily C protein CydD